MTHRPSRQNIDHRVCEAIPGAIVDGTSHYDNPLEFPPPEKTFTRLSDEERSQNFDRITAEWTAQIGALPVKQFLAPKYPELFS